MKNNLKIVILNKIDNDINILNKIDNDINILIIKKIDLLKFNDNIDLYEDYIKNIFKNVYLPTTLNHLIIEDFNINDSLIDIDEYFLTDIFKLLKLPFNCVIDAKLKFRNCYNCPKIKYYSSLKKTEKEFSIKKNTFELLNTNEKFYNEYYKYVEKN